MMVDDDVKIILTYTGDEPDCKHALYKIEGNNEYYYYKEELVGGTTYTIKKRQKYSIVTNVATEELLPNLYTDEKIQNRYYPVCRI